MRPLSGRGRVVDVAPLFAVVVRPFQKFVRLEAASGILLLACAAIALALANSGWSEAYRAILDSPMQVAVGRLRGSVTRAGLVNDGLMTIFFFVVGLEIKRELVVGELRTVRQALLPGIAALGGMILPAGIYLALNTGGPGRAGWAIPIATDIAFCVGVLTLLRSRVPYALVVFVTALAIFDDIGGILVIAIYYGTGIHLGWIAIAGALTLLLLLMSRAHVRRWGWYVVVGGVLWYALHHAGIHATIAGVIVGLCVPARPRSRAREVISALAEHMTRLKASSRDEGLDYVAIHGIREQLIELQSPLARMERALHPWVAFGIMPLFALANAGVDVRALGPSQLVSGVAVGTAAGLVLGKVIGIFTFTSIAVLLGVAPMPGGASIAKLLGVSMVAGVGFTVALFIAALAFPGSEALLAEAKVGILAGSLVAGLAGSAILLSTTRDAPREA